MAVDPRTPRAPEASKSPKAPPVKTMLVVATRQGFYVNRSYTKGQKFHVRERDGIRIKGGKRQKITISCEAQFSEKWMKRIEK